MRLVPTILSVGILAIFLAYGCRHQLPELPSQGGGGGVNPPPAQIPCSPDTVYFHNDIRPLLASSCAQAGCHDNASQVNGVNLTTYQGVMKEVTPFRTDNSKLYRMITRTDNERMPPPPRPRLTQQQIDKIATWINQGAKNNSCAGRCDTTVFTYSAAIKPLVETKCAGCHNPANLNGGVDVSTHNGLRTIALNGKLYGVVTHSPGFSPMPKNAAKLSDCEITQIQKWIAAGAPNN